MLGYPRRKAFGEALRILKPQMDAARGANGWPKGFWEDPFVLGYIGAFSALATDHAYRRQTTAEERAEVLFGLFEELSGLSRDAMARPYLAYGRIGHAEFGRGTDHASKLWHFLVGRLPNEHRDPDVTAATKLATGKEAGAPPPSREAIGRCLGRVLFETIVAKRFGEKA